MTNGRCWLGLALLLLAACGDDDDSGPAGDGDADADADSDGDADGDGDGDADTDCDAVTTSDDPNVQAYIDYIQGVMETEDIPGAAISILRGGEETPIEETRILLGRKQAGQCGAITSETRFIVGLAGTGAVTATAIANADAEGTLDLGDSIAEYVDVVPPEVTFSQLLLNTSGLAPDSDYLTGAEDCLTLEDHFEAHAEDSLWFTPGTLQQFGVREFALAAYGLGVADGGGFAQSIQNRVLDPLRMHATFDREEALAGDLATGRENGTDLRLPSYCELAASVHELYASIDDMARLVTFLMGDDSVAELVQSPDPDSPNMLPGVGSNLSGIWEYPYNRETTWLWNASYFYGYWQEISIFPGLDLGIVALFDGVPHTFSAFGPKAAEMLAGAMYETYDDSDPSGLVDYAGTYVDPLGLDGSGTVPRTIVVTFDEDTGVLDACLPEGCLDEGLRPCGGWLDANPNPAIAETRFADVFCVAIGDFTPAVRFWRDEKDVPTTLSSLFGEIGPPFYRQDDPL